MGGRGERRRGGGRETRGRAEGRGEGELARLPIDAGVVACQPGEAEDELKVAERHDVAGKAFGMGTVNPKMRRVKVGDRTSGRNASVNKLKGNGEGGEDRGREKRVGGWGGGRRGGERKTRGGAEGGGEGELARLPVDAGIVACQPGEAEDELKVAERHDVAGKVFGMGTVNPKM